MRESLFEQDKRRLHHQDYMRRGEKDVKPLWHAELYTHAAGDGLIEFGGDHSDLFQYEKEHEEWENHEEFQIELCGRTYPGGE